MSLLFEHQAGEVIECLSIAITLSKEIVYTPTGQEVLRCGFRIGGGIDQDYRQSPQHVMDNGVYVTNVSPDSPASRCGLRPGDKILQCNGYDFTMVTHKKAVEYISKSSKLNLLVARRGITSQS